MNLSTNISAIDLFCGIGGLSHGLKKSGIPVLAGIDSDVSCRFAYESNNEADFIGGDITSITGEELLNKYWDKPGVKVLVGCAPCQPFSTHANKIKDEEKEGGKKWNLLNEFARLIEETDPEIVSMENVPNLANKKIFQEFVDLLKSKGYHVAFSKVYCPDYGIPQKRRRLVLLASRFGEIALIEKTHDKSNYKTTHETIGDLPRLDNGQRNPDDALHYTTALTDINLKRIKASKPNGTWMDWDEELRLPCHNKETGGTYKSVYGRMSWNEPSPTITTQFYNFGTGRFGHPEQDRALSVREAALLQTFPQDYKFYQNEGDISMTKLGTQIGNAVPVDLGCVIGKSILSHLQKHERL